MRFRIFKVEHATDYIITALLLVSSLAIAINRHQNGMNTLRQVSITIVSVLEEPLSNVRVYRQALGTNRYLQRQNILLQDELSRLRAVEIENRELKELLSFQESTTLELTPVRFVKKDLTGINNTFTVNAGKDQLIKVGMPVLNSDGLIGKVILTNNKYSQVMPYFNNLFRVSARIQETRTTGIVSWEGENMTELVMNFVPKTIQVEPGFIIETSGFGNEFPAGIPIGVVLRTEELEGIDTQKIFLKPFTSLSEVAEGFIVNFENDTSIVDLTNNSNDLFR